MWREGGREREVYVLFGSMDVSSGILLFLFFLRECEYLVGFLVVYI